MADQQVHLESGKDASGTKLLRLSGHLSANTAADIWNKALHARPKDGGRVVVDATNLEYCDGTGIAMLLDLESHQHRHGANQPL